MEHIEYVPAGCYKGLLPRTTKVGERCPVYADTHVVVPRAEWPSLLPGHVGLDPYVAWWFHQGQVGSCGAEAENNGYMLISAASGRPFRMMNPYGMYYTTSGGRDKGSNLEENLEFGEKFGHFPEDIWPRSKGWQAKPSTAAYAEALKYRNDEHNDVTTIDAAGSCMFAGFAFYWGSAGHAKCGIRVLNQDWFKYLNSYGKGWSDPMAGRWLASQLWGDRDETWLMHCGLLAATLHATPDGRTQWEPELRTRWKQAYGTLAATGELNFAEQIYNQLQADEWSGRGVERFSRINWQYGAFAQRTVVDSAA